MGLLSSGTSLLPTQGWDHFLCITWNIPLPVPSDQESRVAPSLLLLREWRPTLVRVHPGLVRWSARIQMFNDSPSDDCSLHDDLFSTKISVLHRHVPSQRRTRRRQPAWWTLECFEACVARNGAWRENRRNPECELHPRTTFPPDVAPLAGLNGSTMWKPSRE